MLCQRGVKTMLCINEDIQAVLQLPFIEKRNYQMEEMDVLIHPKRQELIINPEHLHGPVYKMGGMGLGFR